MTGLGKTGVILLKEGAHYKKFAFFFTQGVDKNGFGVFDKAEFIP